MYYTTHTTCAQQHIQQQNPLHNTHYIFITEVMTVVLWRGFFTLKQILPASAIGQCHQQQPKYFVKKILYKLPASAIVIQLVLKHDIQVIEMDSEETGRAK